MRICHWHTVGSGASSRVSWPVTATSLRKQTKQRILHNIKNWTCSLILFTTRNATSCPCQRGRNNSSQSGSMLFLGYLWATQRESHAGRCPSQPRCPRATCKPTLTQDNPQHERSAGTNTHHVPSSSQRCGRTAATACHGTVVSVSSPMTRMSAPALTWKLGLGLSCQRRPAARCARACGPPKRRGRGSRSNAAVTKGRARWVGRRGWAATAAQGAQGRQPRAAAPLQPSETARRRRGGGFIHAAPPLHALFLRLYSIFDTSRLGPKRGYSASAPPESLQPGVSRSCLPLPLWRGGARARARPVRARSGALGCT